MNQFKREKVIMLPTENKLQNGLQPYLNLKNNILSIPLSGAEARRLAQNSNYQSQHLYIISDDEIKEGDLHITSDHEGYGDKKYKIIATTDTSLNVENYITINQRKGLRNTYPIINYLPQPSQQFIEKYIECYNKGNILKDVLVEYEDKVKDKFTSFDTGKLIYFEPKFKINPKDNTITIKKIKDSYSKEEIIVKMKLALQKGIYLESNVELNFDEDKWIEENL